MNIMHHGDDPWHATAPELFTVFHDGDFGGAIRINTERKPEMVHAADSPYARHGNAIYEVEIPFDVIAQVVAEAVRRKRIGALEDADHRALLGLKGGQ